MPVFRVPRKPDLHTILHSTHTDTTAAAVVRGDLVTGQGATPKFARLPKGTLGQFLKQGANEAAWAAHGLTASDILRTYATTYHFSFGLDEDAYLLIRPWTDETVTIFVGQPDVPRNVFLFLLPEAFQTMTGTVTINGIDANGATLQEIYTVNTAMLLRIELIKAFAVITSIVADQTDITFLSQYSVGSGEAMGFLDFPWNATSDVFKISHNSLDFDVSAAAIDITNGTVNLSPAASVIAGDTVTVWYRPYK